MTMSLERNAGAFSEDPGRHAAVTPWLRSETFAACRIGAQRQSMGVLKWRVAPMVQVRRTVATLTRGQRAGSVSVTHGPSDCTGES